MLYEEHIPKSKLLQQIIDCFWTISFSAGLPFQKEDLVLPDGGVEWVFSLGDPYRRESLCSRENVSYLKTHGLVGPRTKTIRITQSRECQLFVIRFKPFGLAKLGFWACDELIDDTLTDTRVFGSLGDQIYELCENTRCQRILISKVEALLLAHITDDQIPDIVTKTWDHIVRSKGKVRITALSEQLNVSKRHISRRFKAYTGVGPKKLADIVRMNHLVIELTRTSRLTQLSYDHGYFDQSHMIHDFRRFTGETPASFLRKERLLPHTLAWIASTRQSHFQL